ncbi:MAG TPA: formyltransferase family protein, partial [Devosia sp.]|nr:formyltransferase family protein [Devosia sp.]
MARALFVAAADILAAGALRGWIESGNEVAEIWTDPGFPLPGSQRTMSTWAPGWSVRSLARTHGIPARTMPASWRRWTGVTEAVSGLAVDVLITCVTMQIVPPAILDMFAGRAVNFHPALLPNYRGPSPYLGTILDGRDDCAGVTLHELTAGIDEGPTIAATPVSYAACGRRYPTWKARHAAAARRLGRTALPAFLAGGLPSRPQGEGLYRRVREEIRIGPQMTAAEARRTASLIGRTGRLEIAGRRGVHVRAVTGDAGLPTGAPPDIGPLSVTIDVADRRLRL